MGGNGTVTASENGWRKCELTVNASKVPGDLTNFPVLLDETCIHSESLDKDGLYHAEDGNNSNIQFWDTEAGSARYNCEIVTLITDNNPANGEAEIHVKLPSVNGTVNTTFWMWYGKSGETQPAADAAYGSEGVWDANFKMVQHMNEDPSGSTPQMIDSTSNDNDGTSSGTMLTGDLVVAQIGNGLDFDGGDDYIDCQGNASLDLDGDTFTLEAWVEPDVINVEQGIAGRTTNNNSRYSFRLRDNGKILVSFYIDAWKSTADDGTALSQDTKHYVVGVYDGSHAIRYLDGSTTGANLAVTGNLGWQSSHIDLAIGDVGVAGGKEFNGVIDEVRISNNARSANWIETCHNNQNDPATFVTEGTPE